MINRSSTPSTDHWLTPPPLVKAGGPFDLDPACHPAMPWRTARKMICLGKARSRFVTSGDGLEADWFGRVFLNHPYSNPLAWITKMVAHNNGLCLAPAKGTDTRWGSLILENASAILFFKGRLLFHYPSGKPSTGKWSPSMLAAFGPGQKNIQALKRVQQIYPGTILYPGAP